MGRELAGTMLKTTENCLGEVVREDMMGPLSDLLTLNRIECGPLGIWHNTG